MLRTTMVWTGLQGTPYYNQLYFEGTGESFAQPAADAAFEFWGAAANTIGPGYTGNILDEVEQVNPTTGQVDDVFQTSTDPLNGFAAGELLPPANQGLVRLLTSQFVNGRRLRGRVFIPGPVESQSTAGVPNSTYTGHLNTAVANLLSSSVAAGGVVIYSHTHRVWSEVVSGSAWNANYAVLRSRRD